MSILNSEELGKGIPKDFVTVSKYKPEDFVKETLAIKKRMDWFRYQADNELENDYREDYEQFIIDADKYIDVLEDLTIDITNAIEYYNKVRTQTKNLFDCASKYQRVADKYQAELLDKGIDILDPLASAKKVEIQIKQQADDLLRRKTSLEQVEKEIAITEEVLAKKKSEMELALQHRYTLTPQQRKTLIEEKDMILDGIEQWGSVSGALSHNKKITSKASTIALYCQKFPEFAEAINVSKILFKDKLDGIMIDRAIEGTENPQFGKGEYIGDYKIKDNKLFMELVKSKIPEEYNKKAVETVKNQQINTMNIISFANIDETKEGFTKDVGVVLDVDETGKVKRITQEEKMIDFYKNKPGAEIIEPYKDVTPKEEGE